MRIGNIQDCKNCTHSVTYGDLVHCNSDNYSDKEFFIRNGRYCAGNCKSFVKNTNDEQSGLIKQSDAISFMLAGKAEFVLHSTKTNEDFKFLITRRESNSNKEEYVYFVNIVLAREKIYAGHIRFDTNTEEFIFTQGNKGQSSPKDRNVRTLMYVLNKLIRYESIDTLRVYHVGKCGRCSKRLTTPESILTGLGPTCSKNLGIPRRKVK